MSIRLYVLFIWGATHRSFTIPPYNCDIYTILLYFSLCYSFFLSCNCSISCYLTLLNKPALSLILFLPFESFPFPFRISSSVFHIYSSVFRMYSSVFHIYSSVFRIYPSVFRSQHFRQWRSCSCRTAKNRSRYSNIKGTRSTHTYSCIFNHSRTLLQRFAHHLITTS